MAALLPAALSLALAVLPGAAADPGDPPQPTDTVEIQSRRGPAPPVGALRWVAVPTLRPCAAADGACAADALVAGTPLQVVAVGAEATVQGRETRWIQVAPPRAPGAAAPPAPLGWVLDHQLSGASWAVDLDEDGAAERVVVRFGPAEHVELVVVEPAAAPQVFDLGAAPEDMIGVKNRAAVSLVPAATAGLPLVRVKWLSFEACGSGDHFRYVSHRSPGPGAPGVLQVALEHAGSGGDAPIWWETRVAFDPAAGTATLHSRAGETDDDGKEHVNSDEQTVLRLDRAAGRFRAPEPAAPTP